MLLADLDPEVSTFIQQHTTEIKERMRRSAQDVVEIGQRLIEVKERLGHGHFLEWIKTEFDWHRDTANKFMHVAEQFGTLEMSKFSTFAPSALYLLAASSTPSEARIEALELAEQGETISHAKAKVIVERHKADGADDDDLASFEALATTPLHEMSVASEQVEESSSDIVEPAEESEESSLLNESDDGIPKSVEAPKTTTASLSKELLPFHCLMSQHQRERLFAAINQAKSTYELKTTAEALDTIAQEFLNA